MKTMNIALIPAYEPDAVLPVIAKELKRQGLEVVVVDDGSAGHCAEVFAEAGTAATVLHHAENETNRRCL